MDNGPELHRGTTALRYPTIAERSGPGRTSLTVTNLVHPRSIAEST